MRQQWVFGGTEVGTLERKLLVAVPRRNAATLLPVIQQYILPGITIISDCWAAYQTLGQLGYIHLPVNHSIQFVNPANGACTNHVKCYWKNCKNVQQARLWDSMQPVRFVAAGIHVTKAIQSSSAAVVLRACVRSGIENLNII